jgi:hypothetical protein
VLSYPASFAREVGRVPYADIQYPEARNMASYPRPSSQECIWCFSHTDRAFFPDGQTQSWPRHSVCLMRRLLISTLCFHFRVWSGPISPIHTDWLPSYAFSSRPSEHRNQTPLRLFQEVHTHLDIFGNRRRYHPSHLLLCWLLRRPAGQCQLADCIGRSP